MTKYYAGERDADGNWLVWVYTRDRRRALPLRLDLANHSPTGFAWGYGGSGPAQLALAILADALANDELALRLHQQFKWRVICPLPQDQPWRLQHESVADVAADLVIKSHVGA